MEAAKMSSSQDKDTTPISQLRDNYHNLEIYFNAVFNTTGDPIFVKDNEFKFLLVNDAFCRIFRLSKDDVIGKTLVEKVSSSEREHFLAIDRQVLDDGKEVLSEETLVIDGAQSKTILTRKNRFIDPAGRCLLIGVIYDITERKQVELREKARSNVLELITSGEALPVILEAIVLAVEQENPSMLCSVLLLDEAGSHLLTGVASSLPDFYNEAVHGLEIGIGAGSCGTAAFTNERVIVDNIQTHPYWKPFKEVANKAGLSACWSEPIRSTKGKVLGTFAIYHHQINYPTAADLAVIERSANLASVAIEKRQAELMIASSESRLRLALAVSKQVWSDQNVLTGEVLSGREFSQVIGNNPFEFRGHIKEWEDSLHPEDRDAVLEAHQRCLSQGSAFCMEYRKYTKNGSLIWVNSIAEVTEWSSSNEPLRIIGMHTNITQMKEYQGRLERIANYDALTNLPNRALLADRLNQAMLQSQRRQRSVAVAFMDLDGFKDINDTQGHNVGDQLLVALSQRMKEALREGDTLARIGGDEFIVVMVDLEKITDSESVLDRLLKAASDPITLGDAVIQVSISIGVTLYPQDGVDADQLMRHADQAMYVAKQAGKNRYHLFDTEQDNAIKTQRQSIDEVTLALERHEFVLHYQPKVNMCTAEIIGVEALIRWQHPELGLLPPIKFLPAIEGHIISLKLGEWVIDTALGQISQWQSLGVNLPISVNISAYQLQQVNFAARLAGLLTDHPEVNLHCLELEILETSALSDISQVSATMAACKKLGVRFALDDFGTGYSSLTYLRRLPAYLIKIDQSFVRDMLIDTEDLAIVEGIIGLAKSFKREVIAEGVETIAHGEALLKLGCELAQGYGIARPMPAIEIPAWASNWKTVFLKR
jgi:diguanylate cyclase (GGDEF)-like protein/PAS domain S-box-containing protein